MTSLLSGSDIANEVHGAMKRYEHYDIIFVGGDPRNPHNPSVSLDTLPASVHLGLTNFRVRQPLLALPAVL